MTATVVVRAVAGPGAAGVKAVGSLQEAPAAAPLVQDLTRIPLLEVPAETSEAHLRVGGVSLEAHQTLRLLAWSRCKPSSRARSTT